MSIVNRKYIYVSLMAIILLALILAGGKIIGERAFDYGYNQQQDYQYQFNPDYAEIVPAKLEKGQLNLSLLSRDVTTVLVEIGIRSTLRGFLHEPEVFTIAGDDTLRQNFECRANGIRYLNVSGLVQEGLTHLNLKFFGCEPITSNVKLIVCHNPDLSKERILILAPHPDDAEIAAYGLYSTFPENTFIVTITAGDAGSMRYDELYRDSVRHYVKKGKVRVWNSLVVPQLAGIASENAINLGYFDALLKPMHNDTLAHGFSRYIKTDDITLFRSENCSPLLDSLTPESTWRSLVNDLKTVLLKKRPTIILSTYPAIDWHFDHKFTTVALLQAMRETRYDSCQLWLYTNHLPLSDMYPGGKVGSSISLPPCFDSQSVYFDRLCSFPLSAERQSDKALALDAMNDLRPNTQYRDIKTSWKQTQKNFWNKLYLKESDYFRRSVRSNELFFVIDGAAALQPGIEAVIFGEL